MCVKRAGSLRRQAHQAPGTQEFGIAVFRFKRGFRPARSTVSFPPKSDIRRPLLNEAFSVPSARQ